MQVAVITELCDGGSLFHTLRNRGVSAWPWCAYADVMSCLCLLHLSKPVRIDNAEGTFTTVFAPAHDTHSTCGMHRARHIVPLTSWSII